MTDRARFALDAQFTPADASLSVEDRSGRPGIYIAPDVEPWINGYGYWRPFVAEFRVDPSVVAAPGVHGRWGDELFVPATSFGKLDLQRVIPLDAYAREVFREHGWIESRLGREFDTGREIPERSWDAPRTPPFSSYRYSGPDVRDMPPAEVRRLKRDLHAALQTTARGGQAAQRWRDQQEIRRDDLEVPWRERQRRQAPVRAARLRAVQRVRRRHPELPAPVELLDVGMQGGWVFSTTDPDTVVRVGGRFWGARDELAREELFLDPDFASGVVQVRFLTASRKYIVAWKERVDLDVEGFLHRTYPETQARDVAHALLDLWGNRETALWVLARCAATRGLARAIHAGLPTEDLGLNANLGVTRDGRVVAFDL